MANEGAADQRIGRGMAAGRRAIDEASLRLVRKPSFRHRRIDDHRQPENAG
jgi:hypothetical protein